MARTRIKVCGITREDDAFLAVEAGADAVGFVLAPNSPRSISAEKAGDIAVALPPFVTKVALFVDAKAAAFEELLEEHPFFEYAQLHGRESEPTVKACAEVGVGLIKAIKVGDGLAKDILKWNNLVELDAVLLDGGTGGQGERFDWEEAAEAVQDSEHPVIVAGGLTAENVGEAIEILQPFAVDVSSGVEKKPGVKDASKLVEFCQAVRESE